MEQRINYNLTIVSVSFNSAQFLKKNYQLTETLNKSGNTFPWDWIVIENSINNSPDKLRSLNHEFRIIPGVDAPNVPNEIKGSYQHGLALNKALESITSRYLLIIDPDFYIVRKNWINEVIEYMSRNDLAFFGVPWHPKHFSKYRYFPSIHCLFVDLQKIRINEISFVPEILGAPDTQDFSHLPNEPRFILAFNKKILPWVQKIKILNFIYSFIHNNFKK